MLDRGKRVEAGDGGSMARRGGRPVNMGVNYFSCASMGLKPPARRCTGTCASDSHPFASLLHYR